MSTNPSPKTLNPAGGQGKVGRGGYNKLRTDNASSNWDTKREKAHTVSGYDLAKYLKKEKQYTGMDPMERFMREGGSSLERRATRKMPKGVL